MSVDKLRRQSNTSFSDARGGCTTDRYAESDRDEKK